MYSLEEIKTIVAQGENDAVEFKEMKPRPESLAREMVAFANTSGGVILIGVDNGGHVVGLNTLVKEEWVHNIARNNVHPSLSVSVEFFTIDGKELVLVFVPKGPDKPYQTADKYLIRAGSTNRSATQAELVRLFQAAGTFHYDGTGVARTSIKDINLTKVDQYFDRYGFTFADESEEDKVRVLKNADILAESGMATVGGLLMFGLNPERYLPQCGISFAHFKGTEIGAELVDKHNIAGTLDFQVDSCLAVFRNNFSKSSDIESGKRTEPPTPPEKALRELIVNALVHRNYSIVGSQVRIFMFADRIEFISPGRLPNTITVEKLKVGVSYAVNPILVKFMDNLRYVDRLGRGLPMVWREMTQLGKLVEFKEIGEEFKVTIGV